MEPWEKVYLLNKALKKRKTYMQMETFSKDGKVDYLHQSCFSIDLLYIYMSTSFKKNNHSSQKILKRQKHITNLHNC